MNLLKVKNESPISINVATFNDDGKLEQCFNHLAPGAVVKIECAEQHWLDYIVMASEGNNKLTRQDKLNEVVGRSIDSAFEHGVLSSKFHGLHLNKSTKTIFASICLNS